MDSKKQVELLRNLEERFKRYAKKAVTNPKIRAALNRDRRPKDPNDQQPRKRAS